MVINLKSKVIKTFTFILVFPVFIGTVLFIFYRNRTLPQANIKVYDIYKISKYLNENNWKLNYSWSEDGRQILYTLRYPSDWNVIKVHPRNSFFTPQPRNYKPNYPDEYITVMIKDNPENTDIKEWFQQQYPTSECTEVIVNKKQSCQNTYIDESRSLLNILTAIPSGNRVAEIILNTQGKYKKELEKVNPYFIASFLHEGNY